MNWTSVTEIVSTVALVVGVIFAIIQVRHFRKEREREAALELLHSFQTPEFAQSLYTATRIPPGLSRKEIEERLGPDMQHLYSIMTTWETLGVLVYKREISLALVEDYFSGAIVLSWNLLNSFVLEEREALGRSTLWEWFQWLAERIKERESSIPPVPAYTAHQNWRSRD